MLDVEKFIEGLHEYLGKALRPIGSRLDAIERRLEAAEAAPMAYAGIHEAQRQYLKNEVVTHSGGLWIALRETQQKPGDGDAWQLCVKAGRDGRDAR